MWNHKITDIFFDLYGTLVNIHTEEGKIEAWREVREEVLRWGEGCCLSVEQMRDIFFEKQDYLRRQHKDDKEQQKFPEIDMYPLFSFILSGCGVLPFEERVMKIARIFRLATLEYCYLYDGAMEFLMKLKQSGKRIWLVTNAQKMFTLPEIEKLGLDNIFDGIYISSEIGFRKPDRRIFLAPIIEHGLNPDHIVMIGNDGSADIIGAKSCGLRTIYFRTNCSPKGDIVDADFYLEGADYVNAFKWILGEKF